MFFSLNGLFKIKSVKFTTKMLAKSVEHHKFQDSDRLSWLKQFISPQNHQKIATFVEHLFFVFYFCCQLITRNKISRENIWIIKNRVKKKTVKINNHHEKQTLIKRMNGMNWNFNKLNSMNCRNCRNIEEKQKISKYG